MAITHQVTCDVCGKVKQAVNHWWIFVANEDGFRQYPWRKDSLENFGHLCGQECATKKLSEWMASQSEQSK